MGGGHHLYLIIVIVAVLLAARIIYGLIRARHRNKQASAAASPRHRG